MKRKSYPFVCLVCAALIFMNGSAGAQTVYKTPRSAASALYKSWRAKDKAGARRAADAAAVNKLFGTNFIKRRKFAGCTDESETEKGLFSCVYADPTDDSFNVNFETIKKGKSWRVRRATFAAEN